MKFRVQSDKRERIPVEEELAGWARALCGGAGELDESALSACLYRAVAEIRRLAVFQAVPLRGELNGKSCLIELVDDITGKPCALRPEHIQSMGQMRNGLTKLHTDVGFVIAREPDYFALVDHWRDLMQDKVKATGIGIVRVRKEETS